MNRRTLLSILPSTVLAGCTGNPGFNNEDPMNASENTEYKIVLSEITPSDDDLLAFDASVTEPKMGYDTLPEIYLTIENISGTELIFEHRGSWLRGGFFPNRPSTPDGVMLLDSSTLDTVDIQRDRCPKTDHDPGLLPDGLNYTSFDPDESRRHSLYLVGDENVLEGACPSEDDYEFSSKYRIGVDEEPPTAEDESDRRVKLDLTISLKKR